MATLTTPLLTKEGDTLIVETRGSWPAKTEQREKIKDIPGRRWDPNRKAWILPADAGIADQILKTLRPEVDDELMNWLRESMVEAEESLTSPIPDDAAGLLIPWGYRRAAWQPESVNDEKFEGALDYQRAGIYEIATRQRQLLGDDMGLGKTFMAISAVEEWILRNPMPDNTTREGPRLAIAPASVLGGWDRELHRWLKDPRVRIIDGKSIKTRHQQLTEAIQEDAWTIVNWEQIRIKKVKVRTERSRKDIVVMKEPLFQYPQAASWDLGVDEWDVAAHAKAAREFKNADPYWLAVIADEAHRAKNRASQQTLGLHRIQGNLMLGMTGTPIMNSPDEIWALLAWLWPHEYHARGASHSPGALSYWAFYNQYVKYYEDHFGKKTVTGVKNPDALRFALKGKLIRRTAESKLNLKGRKRIYLDVPLNPGQQKLYAEAEKAMWLAIEKDAVAGNKDAIALAQAAANGADMMTLMRIPNGAARFVRLQQIIENAALLGGADDSGNMDDFEQHFEDSRPEPWVVFANYKESCEILATRLRKKYGATVAVYTGDVPSDQRTEIEDAFQRGEIDVVVGTIGAMREGITLTRGNLQYWLSRAVVPAWNEQGEGRNFRKGQQKFVRIYIPHATNTVAPDKVHAINRLKESIVKVVLPQDTIEEVTHE